MTFAGRMGANFAPRASPILTRAVQIARGVQEQLKGVQVNTKEEQRDKRQREEFLISAIDVISSITGAIARQHTDDLKNFFIQNNVLDIVFKAASQSDNNHVQRSGFSLVGDFFQCVPSVVADENVYSKFIQLAISNLNPHKFGVCINALWTIGEAIQFLGVRVQPFCTEIIKYVAQIIKTNDQLTDRKCKDNSAIILARLAYHLPEEINKYVHSFKEEWMDVLMRYPEDDEKAKAFYGLVKILMKDPSKICAELNDVTRVVSACLCWWSPPSELNETFSHIFKNFIEQLGQENWAKVCAFLSPENKKQLQQRYNMLLEPTTGQAPT